MLTRCKKCDFFQKWSKNILCGKVNKIVNNPNIVNYRFFIIYIQNEKKEHSLWKSQ